MLLLAVLIGLSAASWVKIPNDQFGSNPSNEPIYYAALTYAQSQVDSSYSSDGVIF
jgi:hypothetical protein